MLKGFRKFAPAVALAGALLATALPGSARAQSVPFTSGFQVQNLASVGATISMAFYAEGTNTAPVATVPATITANGQVTYAVLPSQVAAGFKGSAVISSDQKIAAIVNLISPSLSNIELSSSYVGVTSGARQAALPLLFKDYFDINTFFSVQNVGQSSTTINVAYSNGQSDTATIPPGGSARFDQTTSTKLPAEFNGSAIVTSTASDIAAVVTQYSPTQSLTYNGFAAGTTNPILPLVNINNFGTNTGIALQNTGAAATDVTIEYTRSSDGFKCTERKNVPARGTRYFALNAFNAGAPEAGTTENCPDGAAFVGSARVSANTGATELVAIVNQVTPATNKGGAYSSFNATTATNTAVFPLIMDRNFGFFTGISVQNVGTVPTTITCTYSGIATPQTSGNIAPGAAYVVVHNNALGNGYVGSARCVANATGAKIVGIANQIGGGTNDTLSVYEAVNN